MAHVIEENGRRYFRQSYAARKCGHAISTLKRWTLKGLPHIERDGCRYYSLEDIEKWYEDKHRKEPPKPPTIYKQDGLIIDGRVYHMSRWYVENKRANYYQLRRLPCVILGKTTRMIAEEDFEKMYVHGQRGRPKK